jgi:Family of unknown function (DUF5302)
MTKDAQDAKDPDKPENDRGDQPVAAPSAAEVKRKFREALDKKHAHGGRDVSEDGDQAKIHDAHGPAKAQQMFRRKSGG